MSENVEVPTINWDQQAVWPATVAAKFLGIRRGRMLRFVKLPESLPEGAPSLAGGQDEASNQWYLDSESVKSFKLWIDANPDALGSTVRQTYPGRDRYVLYCNAEELEQVKDAVPEAIIEDPRAKRKARKPKKAKAEPVEVIDDDEGDDLFDL